MNETIARGMINKMVATSTKPAYVSLKHKEEELLAQLEELREEIKIAENNIIKEKLNTAIRYLVEIDEITNRHYRCPIATYCESCGENIDIDIDLAEIIEALLHMN